MLVLGTLVDVEVGDDATGELVLGQHTLDGVTEQTLGTVGLCQNLGRRGALLTAGITAVAQIFVFGDKHKFL